MCVRSLYFKAILALQPMGNAFITQATVGGTYAFTPSRQWAGLCYRCIPFVKVVLQAYVGKGLNFIEKIMLSRLVIISVISAIV